MFRRVVVSVILAIWCCLLAIELSEELGLFVFASVQTDQAADDALDGFGKAIPTAYLEPLGATPLGPSELAIVQPIAGRLIARLTFLIAQHLLAEAIPKPFVPLYIFFHDLRM